MASVPKKKKGLSMDEKRTKILELFYESKEFFQMKELEKIAPKQKGVISQSVQEITKMLVDDGLVECEKIGTFVCYWAFPSKALQTRKRKLETIEANLIDLEAKIEQSHNDLITAAQGKAESEERTMLLKRVGELRSREKELDAKIVAFAQFDPAVMAETRLRTEKAKEMANRWTDNIFSLKKWCKTKFGMEEKMLNKQFEIPEELDYIE